MKVLVTGGCGFVGSHLCELLIGKGYEVTALDDLSTGSFGNISCLESNSRFHVVVDTVLHAPIVDSLVRECGAVFHLASAVGVKLIVDQPVKTIETIVGGTSVVLESCRRYHRPVLITSTSEVYGKGCKIPFSEENDTVQGATSIRRWAYANAKAMDEFLALAHYKETQLPVVCVRMFNTVGPRQTGQYGMVVPRFVKSALSGQPITVYDDGEQSRCFCHVSDVVEALEKLLLNTPEAVGEVINV